MDWRRLPRYQWDFQEPKMEVPIPYIRPIFQAYVREYPHKMWPYMVQYLHFRILKFPLTVPGFWCRVIAWEKMTNLYSKIHMLYDCRSYYLCEDHCLIVPESIRCILKCMFLATTWWCPPVIYVCWFSLIPFTSSIYRIPWNPIKS